MNPEIIVVGAGLAGCEAAWQAAIRGVHVTLYEMKPQKKIPAHHTEDFCELCCSNSFRAEGLQNAIGLLKEELLRCGSL
ncbi:MAG: FAD-dependent oxidoreductase, partial [Clostridia bacterium]|nr:FAD-dependent oxidoreductase [Clostridia bacterium]